MGTSGYHLTELEMPPSTWLAADKVKHPHLPLLELEIHPQALSELFPSLLEESPLEWGHLKVSSPSIIPRLVQLRLLPMWPLSC